MSLFFYLIKKFLIKIFFDIFVCYDFAVLGTDAVNLTVITVWHSHYGLHVTQKKHDATFIHNFDKCGRFFKNLQCSTQR